MAVKAASAQTNIKSSKPRKPHGGAFSRLTMLMIMFMMIAAGAVFVPTTLLVAAGMLPTLAAFVIDQDSKKTASITVGLMNGSGILPYILDLWVKGQTMDHSIEIIRQPMHWLVMYGAAGIGWLIYFSVPSVVQIFLAQRAKLHIVDLEERQTGLRQKWGEEVKTRPTGP